MSHELRAAKEVVGSGVDVESFTRNALQMVGATVQAKDNLQVDVTEAPQGLKDLLNQSLSLGFKPKFSARFDINTKNDEYFLTRTHPLIESLSSFMLESALDPLNGKDVKNPARRCGVIRTKAVEKRTTLLLIRFRYHIIKEKKGEENKPLLAEECGLFAFTGSPQSAEWLSKEEGEKLLQASPDEMSTPTRRVILFKR